MAAFDLLGRRGALRLLWELRNGALNFRTLQAAADTNPALLNRRLKELREAKLVHLVDAGYELTAEGEALRLAIAPLSDWATQWSRHCAAERTPDAPRPTRTAAQVTESVIRNHFKAFANRRGLAAALADYDEDASLHTEARTYRGKEEIGGFYADFFGSLPAGAARQLAVRAVRVDGDVGLVSWSVGRHVPLGSDTFVVRAGRIVAQTMTMHRAG